ncbi:UDP-N-acetylmuramoylalanine--D-glutamate ligase [Methyloceanibacter superfactus]|uniref:UDP-N-acetylmuramoylalanine--D-glutamate ligase n=1 Tax=Methyloceanibacter superfactus TaxID=1774969 RepID=A0A1E3VWT5_9HYPH|nr:UDP-N-acetylmuramoyl-L-alanine--D-glutamate ligase [Methyloceanibacter superfactus]ODR97721.1 UDP-N-acetylmuramoylalanine--D-glutamate ligase [Methyloceanibacter superfactus]
MIPVTIFAGCDVAVVGLGLSGLATARALESGGATVVVWDDTDAARAEAAAAGLTVADLASADFTSFAALVLAPGIPLTHPEPHWSVVKARAAGIEVVGDVELFFRARAKADTKAKVVVITGTNGKSTTTALTAHLLSASGKRVALGGNIGTAVLDLEPFADDLTYVLELSSFQIDLTPSLKPDAAALLNITPDHLDRHGTLADYARINASLRAARRGRHRCDRRRRRSLPRHRRDLARSLRVKHIAVGQPVQNGVWAADAVLVEMDGGQEVARAELAGIASLRGAHNWQNAAAAYAVARAQGVSAAEIQQGLRSFAGLAHRMEQVARAGAVLFVNDSKATNADAAGKALASFDDIYWIVGGKAKAGGLDGLEPFYPKIARAYLIGEAAGAFAAQLGDAVDHVECGTLERAVAEAAADAARSESAEPVVLLSPACASYDQFANFAKRGDAFRDIVMGLDGATRVSQQGRAA